MQYLHQPLVQLNPCPIGVYRAIANNCQNINNIKHILSTNMLEALLEKVEKNNQSMVLDILSSISTVQGVEYEKEHIVKVLLE